MGNTWLRDKATDIEEVTDHPEKQTCWHDESVVTVGNAIAFSVHTSQGYNFQIYQNPAADGDTFEQKVFLATGTYSFYILGTTASSQGIIDWFLDAVEIITAQDRYTVGDTYNVKTITTGINVATSKIYTIKGVVNGKNASSSDYVISLTKFWFEKTA